MQVSKIYKHVLICWEKEWERLSVERVGIWEWRNFVAMLEVGGWNLPLAVLGGGGGGGLAHKYLNYGPCFTCY